jgi:hypothetical protein
MGNCVGRQRRDRPAAPGHPRKRAGNAVDGSGATAPLQLSPPCPSPGFRELSTAAPDVWAAPWLLPARRGPSPAPDGRGSELGQLRVLTRLRDQLLELGSSWWGRGQEMFADRRGAGGGGALRERVPLAWRPGPGSDIGRLGRCTGSLRPQYSDWESTVAPSRDCHYRAADRVCRNPTCKSSAGLWERNLYFFPRRAF